MHRRLKIVAATAVAVLLAACGGNTEDADTAAGNAAGNAAGSTSSAAHSDVDAVGSNATATPESTAAASGNGAAGSVTAGPKDTLPVAEPAASLTEVNYGSVGGMTDSPLWIADKLGLFAEQGIKIKFNRFSAGIDILPALLTDSLDVAGMSVSAGTLNAIKEGSGFKLVGDRQSQQGPGRFGEGFLVAADLAEGVDLDDPAAIADMLRGKKIAITTKNTSTDYMLMKLLATWGMTQDEVEVVALPFTSIATAFHTGALDAAIVLEPFRQGILAEGTAVEISHFDDVIPHGTMVPLTYSGTFADKTELANGFMLAFLKGAMIMNEALAGDSQAYHDQVVDIIAGYSELEPAQIARADPPGINVDEPLDTSYIDEFQDFMVERGVLDEKVDISSAVDDSFAAAARKELGLG